LTWVDNLNRNRIPKLKYTKIISFVQCWATLAAAFCSLPEPVWPWHFWTKKTSFITYYYIGAAYLFFVFLQQGATYVFATYSIDTNCSSSLESE